MRVYWEQGSSRRMERSIKQLEVRMWNNAPYKDNLYVKMEKKL